MSSGISAEGVMLYRLSIHGEHRIQVAAPFISVGDFQQKQGVAGRKEATDPGQIIPRPPADVNRVGDIAGAGVTLGREAFVPAEPGNRAIGSR